MRKKVLLAEQSDATRSVAETVLRQNGFEVVTVTEGSAAMEVLERGKPDLVLVGAEMVHDGAPVYREAMNRGGGSTPVLVFAEVGREVPGVSMEMVVPKPFHPRDLLDRVAAYAGRQVGVRGGSSASPLGEVSDDLLDSALGMGGTGSIKVTESEVMDRTHHRQSRGTQRGDDLPALGRGLDDEDDMDRTGRIESIMITDDATDIRRPVTGKMKRPSEKAADDGGLDILPNQYGLGEGGLQADGGPGEDPAHDYHWFVSEMQREAAAPPAGRVETPKAKPAEDLTFTDPGSTLEEFDPASYAEKKKTDAGGVERFIDEFKREVERFHAEEPESLTLREGPPDKAPSTSWEEVVESITPDQVALFTRQLAAELADRLAAMIVGKLDADKLAHLIKTEVIAQLRTRKER